MNHNISIFTALLISLLPACSLIGSSYGGHLSRPDEARINISAEPMASFDAEPRSILFRYLAGNSRWEIRQERGIKYAVRREKVMGEYKTTRHGFYSNDDDDSVHQTRVLIAFEEPYGLGRDRGNITRAIAGSDDVAVIVEGAHEGTPGNTSYVIIEGDRLYLEIYDQAPETARQFTKKAIGEVFAELADVLKHQDEIKTTGLMPVESRYPGKRPNSPHFKVSDGMQPGIYLLNGAINPTTPGYVYTRVYDVETGQRLSEEQLTSRSTRYVGWSDSGETFFPYNAEVTVYEGDWSNKYEARFELWHKSEQGNEFKIAEITRMINGWER